jgi:hypothetical protein
MHVRAMRKQSGVHGMIMSRMVLKLLATSLAFLTMLLRLTPLAVCIGRLFCG